MAKNGFMENWWLYLKRGIVFTITAGVIGAVMAFVIALLGFAIPVLGIVFDIIMLVLTFIVCGWAETKTVEDWIAK